MKPLDRISGYAHVALRYGLEEAIFLDSLMYWYKENRANQRNYQDGRWWTFNSVKAFQELFPWWSVRQIRRIIDSCKKQGAILTGSFNDDHRDRTAWYTPGDELLGLYGMTENGNCICQNRQMQSSERAGECAQNDKPLPCNNHVYNTPYSPPEGDGAEGEQTVFEAAQKPAKREPDWGLFEQFWAAYPKKRSKECARRAWKRLDPDLPLCRIMSAALERDKSSHDWQREGGKYIPYPATWLNGHRWEDEPDVPPPSVDPADRPVMPKGGTYS